MGQILHRVVGLGDGGGGKGIGLDDIRAGRQIVMMNAFDHIGPGDGQQVVVAPEVHRPIGEPRTAIGGLVQCATLDHGAHGAIQNQDPVPNQTFERGRAVDARIHVPSLSLRRRACRCRPARDRAPIVRGRGLRANAKTVADGIGQFGPVQRIEMEIAHALGA